MRVLALGEGAEFQRDMRRAALESELNVLEEQARGTPVESPVDLPDGMERRFVKWVYVVVDHVLCDLVTVSSARWVVGLDLPYHITPEGGQKYGLAWSGPCSACFFGIVPSRLGLS